MKATDAKAFCKTPVPEACTLWEALVTTPKTAAAPDDVERTKVYREAYAAGVHKAKAAVSQIIERYHQAIVDMEFLRDRIMVDAEKDLVDLALFIAQEVLASDRAGSREFTERMVGEALRMLREADNVTLRLSPTDVSTITKKHPELAGTNSVVRINEDPTLKLGGVIAECRFGKIDATIERRLAVIARQLRDELDLGLATEPREAEPLPSPAAKDSP